MNNAFLASLKPLKYNYRVAGGLSLHRIGSVVFIFTDEETEQGEGIQSR